MRFLSWLRRRKLDARFDEEAAHHLEMLEADYRAKGHSAAEAARLARRDFGSMALHQDAHRDARGLPWLDDLWMDLRHAARQLRHSPLFCLIAVLTMGLGIGANTAIFTLVNAALLRESPYPEPHLLKDITRSTESATGYPVHDMRQFVELRNHASSFAYVAAMRDKGRMNWVQGNSASELRVLRVSAEYFQALGLPPRYGRSFTRAEESSPPASVAIVTEALLERTGGRLDATLNLGGQPHSIVGVVPAGFPVTDVDVFLPMAVAPVQDGENTLVFGRLKAGVAPQAAAQQATQIYRDLIRREYRPFRAPLRITLDRFGSSDGREFQTPLLILSGSVGLILLIACVNLANLLLARASSRSRELAIRASLGAGRFRIVRQLLVESLFLSLLGGLAGLALSKALIPLLVASSPVDLDSLWKLQMDSTVFGYALGISVVAGIVFGLLPAFTASRVEPAEVMKDGGAKGATGTSGLAVRRALVISEIAFSVILLAVSGLLVDGLLKLLALPSGMDESRVIAARMTLRGSRYNTAANAHQFFEQGIERLEQLPTVEAAAVTLALPLERGLNCSVRIPWAANRPEAGKFTNWRYTSANYLEVIRVPLLAGRYFTRADSAGAAPVAIVSDAFVRKYLEGKDPIGAQILETCGGRITRTIVGVVADLKTNTLKQQVPPTLYVPTPQATDTIVAAAHTWFPMSWVVRSRAEDTKLTAAIESTLHSLDPHQPVSAFVTMNSLRSDAVRLERFLAWLVSAFALLAMLLTCAGIYGVISYMVSQRSAECAIRLAMGASPIHLVLSLLGQAARLALVGLLVGAVVSAAVIRMLSANAPEWIAALPSTPAVFVVPLATLAAIVLLASLVPSLRLLRMDPSSLLRSS